MPAKAIPPKPLLSPPPKPGELPPTLPPKKNEGIA